MCIPFSNQFRPKVLALKLMVPNLSTLGQRHFDESVTLDSLPLNDPEHFGNNVKVNKDIFSSNIFTTDDTHTGKGLRALYCFIQNSIADNDDDTDQSGSSIETKEEPKPMVGFNSSITFLLVFF